MFGHDNQDGEEDKGQITLPPAGAFGPDDNSDGNGDGAAAGQPDNGSVSPADPVTASPRKAVKSGAPTDDLLDIKQDALQALTPLVDQLEQTPEEKFRTTMMMIQASDNHGLIKHAYEAAQQIKDEKERAQALLDIVNEINYFTQHANAA